MSFTEYADMFTKTQKYGKYQMFIIDLAGSKKLTPTEIAKAEANMQEKFQTLTDFIKNELNILHTNDSPLYNNNNYFVLGDLCGFCTISGHNAQVEKLIQEEFKNFKYNYHYKTGYYDTDLWAEGNDKYYFGYCIQQLEKESKDIIINNQEER